MLTFREFNREIKLITSIEEKMTSFGINTSDFADEVYELFDMFILSHFTSKGVDLIIRWIYDGEKVITEIKEADLFNKKEVIVINVETIEDLWDYMYKNKEIYFK
jgi:hypothetical protein